MAATSPSSSATSRWGRTASTSLPSTRRATARPSQPRSRPGRASGGDAFAALSGSGEGPLQQREQLGEVTLGGRLVVGGRVGHRVAMPGALVALGAVAGARLVE